MLLWFFSPELQINGSVAHKECQYFLLDIQKIIDYSLCQGFDFFFAPI